AVKTICHNVMLLVCCPNQMQPPTESSSSPRLPQRISLVSLTAQSLRESMQAGHWHGHLPGERELCARLQVSRHTLRAALHELQRDGFLEVSDRQRRRIKTDVKEQTAVHDRVIALISPRPLLEMSPSTVVMVDDLRDQLSRVGFSFEIHVSTACFSATPARALEALTTRSPAAAWLLFGSLEPVQSWFVRRKLPCLVVGSCAPGMSLPSIDADYRALCRHAGGLLSGKGHRHIAFIRPAGDYGGDMQSEQGLREALGGSHALSLQVIPHDGTAAHLCTLLDKTLRSARPPTAYVVARAMHVLTVMMFLTQRGKRIPQDIAVISRDDETFLQHTVPPITRYAANTGQFARSVCKAARQLAEAGTLPPKAIRLMPKLIRGETV
ncbi:substrate-binding domain-containing protein, partial [Prosthecobacter sp.]|uniref:substrate-binding domain-containing protein n=1 Tax=Prosthecobacter sp. TaxID=1965333 RepID=UPI002488AE20